MDAFTTAGLSRIAVACGATASDIATGDPAVAFVERWLHKPVDEWFSGNLFAVLIGRMSDDHPYADAYSAVENDGWLGLEAFGPLPIIRFAGFIEVGVRAGYIKLAHFSARDELQSVLERWDLGQDLRGRVAGLAAALRDRLKLSFQPEWLGKTRSVAGVSAFEDYMSLDEAVHQDSDVREFLVACHSNKPNATKDGFFLSSPEFFVQALTTFRVQRLFVGGQVGGGLKVLRLFEHFSNLLTAIEDVELREAIILHARWAHQADRVFERLARWRDKAWDWNLGRDTSDNADDVWAYYITSTVIPLADAERSLGLLASESWLPDALFGENDFVVQEGVGGTDDTIEDKTIKDLENRGEEAENNGRISAALTLFSKAARFRAERLEGDASRVRSTEVEALWSLIKQIQQLGDKETAAAISSAAYPYLTRHLTHEAKEALDELIRLLRRQSPTASEARALSNEVPTATGGISSAVEVDKEAPVRNAFLGL